MKHASDRCLNYVAAGLRFYSGLDERASRTESACRASAAASFQPGDSRHGSERASIFEPTSQSHDTYSSFHQRSGGAGAEEQPADFRGSAGGVGIRAGHARSTFKSVAQRNTEPDGGGFPRE